MYALPQPPTLVDRTNGTGSGTGEAAGSKRPHPTAVSNTFNFNQKRKINRFGP